MNKLVRNALVKSEAFIEMLTSRNGSDRKIIIENYHGFSNGRQVVLRGRVLRGKEPWKFTRADSGCKNLRGILQYWMTGS